MPLPIHHEATKYLLDGMRKLDRVRRNADLGNRREYIGASDIAAAATGCARRVVLDKLFPNESGGDQDFVRKMRGLALEDMIFNAIKFKNPSTARKIAIHATTPAGAKIILHPDILTFTPSKLIVWEVKSFGELPKEVWPENQVQLHAQISFIVSFWNERRFSIGESDTLYTLPELAKLFGRGYHQQVPVVGHLIYIDGARLAVLEEYSPSAAFFSLGMNNADKLSGYMNSADPDSTPRATGVYLLCDSCDHQASCSRFKGVEMEEFTEFFSRAHLTKQRFDFSKEAFEYEKSLLETTLKNFNDRYVYAGEIQARCSSRKGRKSVSAGRLTDALIKRNFSEKEIDAIVSESMSEGDPYYVVEIGQRKAAKASLKRETEQQLPKAA